MNRIFTNRKKHLGFTLVEMLVVIFIIGILAGLISAAAMRARNRAKVAAMAVGDINLISLSIDQYKNDLGGEYPPDFSDVTTDNGKSIILRHIYRAFPRFVINGPDITTKWQNLRDLIYSNSAYTINTTTYHIDINNFGPDKALVFWLGGMPDAQGRPSGFSKDPANPFTSPITVPSRKGPFYDFDPGRIQNYQYYASGIITGTGQPYVYLRAEQGQSQPKREYYTYDGANYAFKSGATSGAKPYWDQRNMCWVNPTSFQILCCGLDGKFGKENVYPTGIIQKPIALTFPGLPPSDVTAINTALNNDITNTTDNPGNLDHIDDQTNFSSGTIGDDLP